MNRFFRIVSIVFCVFALLSAVVFTINAYHASLYDFNEEGRYFDGVTVHHASAVIGWSCVAILFWAVSGLSYYFVIGEKEIPAG